MIAFTGSKEVGLGILRAAGETPDGPAVRQESRLRDGRQERHHRRRVGRPRRGRARRAAVGLRILRAEMLGVQPGDRPGRRPRSVPPSAGRIDPHAGDRRSGPARHRLRPGDRREGGGEDSRVHRDRQERRPAGTGLRSAHGPGREGGQALRRPAHLLGHRAAASPGQRGGFRPGAGGDAGEAASRRPSTWPIRPPTS